MLTEAGYEYVGMDHFALPDDALAVAKRQGRLHRNFQGYSTQPDCDLIGLGVSAIGRMGVTHGQNAKTLPEYYDLLSQNRLPVVRGVSLSRDDLVRRAVIMGIMCQGLVQYESIELAYMVEFDRYFAPELETLRQFARSGVVTLNDDSFGLTEAGWYLARAVAMVFDRYLRDDQKRARFSKIL
jgi:oxygen-independent coproporphyrinogen-3 oxidase